MGRGNFRNVDVTDVSIPAWHALFTREGRWYAAVDGGFAIAGLSIP